MPTTEQKRTDIDLAHFQSLLQAERTMAEQTIAGTKSAEGDDAMNETGTDRADLSDQPTHPADQATELFLREEDQALIQNAKDILALIERAEEKIAEGTYGLSDRSGAPIPVERLEAIPYATLTTDEQGMQELI
jgi:RNA polymerase-binding transcription factor DksA